MSNIKVILEEIHPTDAHYPERAFFLGEDYLVMDIAESLPGYYSMRGIKLSGVIQEVEFFRVKLSQIVEH